MPDLCPKNNLGEQCTFDSSYLGKTQSGLTGGFFAEKNELNSCVYSSGDSGGQHDMTPKQMLKRAN